VPDALLLCSAFLASLAGMGWLALAKLPHWQQVTASSQPLRARQALRVLGAAAIGLSLTLCLAADHISMSFLVWVMSLAAAALIVAFTLAWRPGWLRALTPGFARLKTRG
jgi:hypothetical protein